MSGRIGLALALVCLSGSALAHHSNADFDLTKHLTLTGKVKEIAFINPHSYLYLSVHDDNGQDVAWRCEMRAATALRRSGWTPEMFAVGKTLTVEGSPSRHEAHTCYVSTIDFSNGSEADRYSQLTTKAKPPAPDRPAGSGRPGRVSPVRAFSPAPWRCR